MDRQEYKDYQNRVADFLKRNDVKPGCYGPAKLEHSEPFFSHRSCECCGSGLSGNRETYSFALNKPEHPGETFEADICTDCVYYLAYDRLDDTTMHNILLS